MSLKQSSTESRTRRARPTSISNSGDCNWSMGAKLWVLSLHVCFLVVPQLAHSFVLTDGPCFHRRSRMNAVAASSVTLKPKRALREHSQPTNHGRITSSRCFDTPVTTRRPRRSQDAASTSQIYFVDGPDLQQLDLPMGVETEDHLFDNWAAEVSTSKPDATDMDLSPWSPTDMASPEAANPSILDTNTLHFLPQQSPSSQQFPFTQHNELPSIDNTMNTQDQSNYHTTQETPDAPLHVRYWKPLSSTASQGSVHTTIKKPQLRKRSVIQSQHNSSIPGITMPSTKASTMPGFMERKNMGRHRSFTDGIRIVQQANQYDPKTLQELSNKIHDSEETAARRKMSSDAMYVASASVPDSLIAFTQEIHQEQRITPKEEVELATKTQEAIRLQFLFDHLEEKLCREPTDAEWCAAAGKINMEALRQTMQEGIDAKNELVTSNLRMVQGVVNVYLRNGLGSQYNAGDLMQEGILALIRAAEKFEPKRGFRFSTYAMYWIRAAIKRAQVGQSRSITIPQRLYENHRKITKVEKELRVELGRIPKASEVAQAAGISKTQVQRCLVALAQQCFSLDAQIENTLKPGSASDRRKSTLYDLVRDKPDDHESQHVKQEAIKKELIETLSRLLTPHEVDLLTLRFGLVDERTMPFGFSGPLSIAEVSKLVGMKPDKVRRRINTSLRQLRSLIADEWEHYERDMLW